MLATLSYEQRVTRGKAREGAITQRMAKRFKMTPATQREDMIDKIDAYMDGAPVQYKFRETGADVLLDIFEPFVGFDSTENKTGRDLASKALWIAVLLRGGRLVVFSKKHLMGIYSNVAAEAKANVKGWDRNTFRSQKFAGVELKVTEDHANGRTKLLMFVNPDLHQHIEVKQ